MKKLGLPDFKAVDVYNSCISRISNTAYKHKLNTSQQAICDAGKQYNYLADNAELYIIDALSDKNSVVINGLTSNELIKLYTDKMVPKKSPGRSVYDGIFALADRCPFCGGVGQTSTLDHYLPKAYFPIYSIHPQNLVPCCSDCNNAKKNQTIKRQQDQVLHPYFDKDFYFDEKWVSAKLKSKEPDNLVLEFFVDPPEHWSCVSKARVKTHFDTYKLQYRFSIESTQELANIVDMRKNIMNNISPEEFQKFLIWQSQYSGLSPNHWRRVMCLALSEDQSFISKAFE